MAFLNCRSRLAHLRLHSRRTESIKFLLWNAKLCIIFFHFVWFMFCIFFLQAVLLLSRVPSETVGEPLEAKRLYDAVNVILSLQVRWLCEMQSCLHLLLLMTLHVSYFLITICPSFIFSAHFFFLALNGNHANFGTRIRIRVSLNIYQSIWFYCASFSRLIFCFLIPPEQWWWLCNIWVDKILQLVGGNLLSPYCMWYSQDGTFNFHVVNDVFRSSIVGWLFSFHVLIKPKISKFCASLCLWFTSTNHISVK